MNLSALVGMSSPAASHHLRQLKDSGLIVSRRVGKEVYYRAADTEVAQLLHQIIERTVEVTCPQSDSQLVSGAPHLPPLDQHDYCGSCPAEQLEVIRQVHRFLTEHLDSRITIEQLSRQFLMNPSTMKELFKEVYGSSIAAHIRQHRMERASALLLESDDSVAQIARTVGYESQSKFTSEFKKAFSMLPTEYRRLHKMRKSYGFRIFFIGIISFWHGPERNRTRCRRDRPRCGSSGRCCRSRRDRPPPRCPDTGPPPAAWSGGCRPGASR